MRVVTVDRENKKIGLSLKQVEENPWTRIEAKYHVGDTVPAKITKLAQFGAFAELEPGVEGLVHISELSDERITHPKQVVREGEDVQLRIIKIDPPRHRLGLSLRQAEDAGEGGYGGYEAWSGGTSYSLGSSAPTTDGGASHDGADVDNTDVSDAVGVAEETAAPEETPVAEAPPVTEEPTPAPADAEMPVTDTTLPPAESFPATPTVADEPSRPAAAAPDEAAIARPSEPADSVRPRPADQSEPAASTEPVANGTARVPER